MLGGLPTKGHAASHCWGKDSILGTWGSTGTPHHCPTSEMGA